MNISGTTNHSQFYLGEKQEEKPNSSPDFLSAPNVTFTAKTLVVKKTLTANDNEVYQGLGQRWAFNGRSTTVIALLTDYVIGIASTTAAYSVNLPKASLAGLGKAYIIKDIGGSATSNNITIDPDGSELINGQTTFPLATNYDTVRVICDGTQWYTI